MLCNPMQCNVMQYNVLQWYAMQCNKMQCNPIYVNNIHIYGNYMSLPYMSKKRILKECRGPPHTQSQVVAFAHSRWISPGEAEPCNCHCGVTVPAKKMDGPAVHLLTASCHPLLKSSKLKLNLSADMLLTHRKGQNQH